MLNWRYLKNVIYPGNNCMRAGDRDQTVQFHNLLRRIEAERKEWGKYPGRDRWPTLRV